MEHSLFFTLSLNNFTCSNNARLYFLFFLCQFGQFPSCVRMMHPTFCFCFLLFFWPSTTFFMFASFLVVEGGARKAAVAFSLPYGKPRTPFCVFVLFCFFTGPTPEKSVQSYQSNAQVRKPPPATLQGRSPKSLQEIRETRGNTRREKLHPR